MINGTKDSTNKHENHIEERNKELAAKARRRRNYDRAIMIAAQLLHMGVIESQPDEHGRIDVDLGHKFEDAVTEVLLMLEAFQLDSPNGEIVCLKFTGER